jgi:hypothetical protein
MSGGGLFGLEVAPKHAHIKFLKDADILGRHG